MGCQQSTPQEEEAPTPNNTPPVTPKPADGLHLFQLDRASFLSPLTVITLGAVAAVAAYMIYRHRKNTRLLQAVQGPRINEPPPRSVWWNRATGIAFSNRAQPGPLPTQYPKGQPTTAIDMSGTHV